MMMDEMLSEIFDEAYDTTYLKLTQMMEASEAGIEAVEKEFASLCSYDGLGWTGRGDVVQARMDGTIAAYQVFLKRFKGK
jgi:hypothetical protein